MADFNRYTRECAFSQLRPELIQAMRDYFENQKLVGIETTILMCCETTSEKKTPNGSRGVLAFLEGEDPDTTVYTGMFVTPEWLVWALSGDKSGAVAAGARLRVLRARVTVAWPSKEFRLELAGFMNDTTEYVRGHLDLGSQPAAEKICKAVSTAVLEQKPPPQKERRRWFGI